MVGKASGVSLAPKWGRRQRRRLVACADKTVVGAPSVRVRLSVRNRRRQRPNRIRGNEHVARSSQTPCAKSENPTRSSSASQSYARNRSQPSPTRPRITAHVRCSKRNVEIPSPSRRALFTEPVMKVHHAEEFGSPAGYYDVGGMTVAAAAETAAIHVSAQTRCRKRPDRDAGGGGGGGRSADAACDAAAVNGDDATDDAAGGCKDCTTEQKRVRKPRRRSGSWP